MADQWSWRDKEDPDTAGNGVFESREAALEDAKRHVHEYVLSEPVTIELGKVEWIDSADYVHIDMDDLLVDMDELAVDDGWFVDFDIFSVDKLSQKKARDDLREVLIAWAKKYVECDLWRLVEEVEEVVIGASVS